MATYVLNVVAVRVRIDYADAAGGYAGWFIMNVDIDGTGGSGADAYSALNLPVSSLGLRAPKDAFRKTVRDKLDHMFGIGCSAVWTGTIIETVTPAVIDDTF